MITQGPFSLTLNAALHITDPGATSNNPATAVQLQNASPFIIDVNVGGAVLTIQSFTAQTVTLDSRGQNGTITPIESNTQDTTAANVLTVVWLLAGERSPMLDGSLTAAAVAFGLEGQGLAGTAVMSAVVTVASNGVSNLNSLPANVRLWNWGYYPSLGGAGSGPTNGVVFMFCDQTGTSNGIDSLHGGAEAASNRLAGLLIPGGNTGHGPSFENLTTVSLVCYVVYSLQ